MSHLIRITIPGMCIDFDHSWDKDTLTTYTYPVPTAEVREWLEAQRKQGHLAHASTVLTTYGVDLFSNVKRPLRVPAVFYPGRITYVFADKAVAMLFKLTFGGDQSAALV